METAELIWQNGEFVPWDEAKTHVLSHGLHYGTGVFEGIRCYETERGPAVFRHREHLARLEKSAELYYFQLPYSAEEIREATNELIRRNGLGSCYIRPLAYRGYGNLGLYATDAPIDVIVAAFPWGVYLGEEGTRHGIRTKVSSWRTISGDSLIPHAKASGQYLNSVLAKTEATNAGYDEAILLDQHGCVSEGSGENVFVVRDGTICTPPHTAAILDGITRNSVVQIATRPRLRGRGARHRPRRALPRRRGLPHRHRRRAGPGARGRRPPAGRAGRDHPRDPGEVPGRAARPRRGVPGVARLRRGPAGADEPSKVSS